jgi:hypothetical protein
VLAVDGGDVEALDAQRRLVERQRALELEEGLVGAPVLVAGPERVAHEHVAGVGLGELLEVPLLAPLRDVHHHLPAVALGEPRGELVGVLDGHGEVDLERQVARRGVVALREAGAELLLPHVEALVEHELAGSADPSLADDEDAGGGDGLLAPEADDVEVDGRGKDHLLLVVEALDGLEPALDAGRPLEVEVVGGRAHLAGELGDELAAMPGEEALDLRDVLGVLLLRHRPAAHPRPPAHMEVEAGSAVGGREDHRRVPLEVAGMPRLRLEGPHGTAPLRAAGRAQGRHPADDVDGLPRRAGVGVGAEVPGAGLVPLAGVLDRGEGVRLGEGDEGIALVVLEVDVEGGPVLLDEVDLEHEGLVLGAHDDVVEARGGAHEARDHVADVLEAHVLAHAGPEVLGLAHVEHLAGGILPEVAARVGRNGLDLLGYARDLAHAHPPLASRRV